MFMPTIMNDNLFRDLFDDDFYMPAFPDMSWMDKKLYGGKAAHEMKTDVKETDKGYEVAVDLPGVKKDDVSVELKDGYLTITARRMSTMTRRTRKANISAASATPAR